MSKKNEFRKESGRCELCLRDEVQTTEHHLTPKEKGGTFLGTANLCIPCHKQIHALFTNAELAAGLHTLEALRANEAIAGFLRWIRKQPPSVLPRINKSQHVRGRR
ncbi:MULTISPECIES: HNH endonuclease [Paenibacillus]|uniref:HNH endonuclease n=1 Tax=Paenibacillus TaxID=44249 RepID=UPI0022B8C855|nr:HNH endonuclease [Paenibacillus caseinilyticus]MCZ8523553.1 HNH endonuclease [Paenibacillus caseinilyticus]